MADQVAIAAGTIVLARVVGAAVGSPLVTATEIPQLESMGDISEQRAEVQATPLKSKSVVYIAGLSDGQPLEMTMFLLTDSAVQNAIEDAFRKGRELEITFQPPDTDKQYRFMYRPTGHMIRAGAGGDPKRRVVAGRLNSAVIPEENENPEYVASV